MGHRVGCRAENHFWVNNWKFRTSQYWTKAVLAKFSYPCVRIRLVDLKHGDSYAACGRLQHCAFASEPWEKPVHGHPASRPMLAFPHHHRWREQQLHQCSPHGCKPAYLGGNSKHLKEQHGLLYSLFSCCLRYILFFQQNVFPRPHIFFCFYVFVKADVLGLTNITSLEVLINETCLQALKFLT